MIEYRVDYDDSVWLPIPDGDPESLGAELIARFEHARGSLPDDIRDLLRELAVGVSLMRTKTTGHQLLFCPPALAPAFAVLGLNVLESDAQIDLEKEVQHDPSAVLFPNVETIMSDYWGTGKRAAVVTDSTIEGAQGGRLNYAFQRDENLLIASATADRIGYATVMMPHADRLVTSVRMEDDE